MISRDVVFYEKYFPFHEGKLLGSSDFSWQAPISLVLYDFDFISPYVEDTSLIDSHQTDEVTSVLDTVSDISMTQQVPLSRSNRAKKTPQWLSGYVNAAERIDDQLDDSSSSILYPLFDCFVFATYLTKFVASIANVFNVHEPQFF